MVLPAAAQSSSPNEPAVVATSTPPPITPTQQDLAGNSSDGKIGDVWLDDAQTVARKAATISAAHDEEESQTALKWETLGADVVANVKKCVTIFCYDSNGAPAGWLRTWALPVVAIMSLWWIAQWCGYISRGQVAEPMRAAGFLLLNAFLVGIFATKLFVMMEGFESISKSIERETAEELSGIAKTYAGTTAPAQFFENWHKAKTPKFNIDPAVMNVIATRSPETCGIEWTSENLAWYTSKMTSVPPLVPIVASGKTYIGWALPTGIDFDSVSGRRFAASGEVPSDTAVFLTGRTESDPSGNQYVKGTRLLSRPTTPNNAVVAGWPYVEFRQRIADGRMHVPRTIGRDDDVQHNWRPSPALSVLLPGFAALHLPVGIETKANRVDALMSANALVQSAVGLTATSAKDGGAPGGITTRYVVDAILLVLTYVACWWGAWGAAALNLFAHIAYWVAAPFVAMSVPFLLSPDAKWRGLFWSQIKNLLMGLTLPIISTIVCPLVWIMVFNPLLQKFIAGPGLMNSGIAIILAFLYPIVVWVTSLAAMKSLFSGSSFAGKLLQDGLSIAKSAVTIGAAVATGGIAGAAGAAVAAGGKASLGQSMGGALRGMGGTLLEGMTGGAGGSTLSQLGRGASEVLSLARNGAKGNTAAGAASPGGTLARQPAATQGAPTSVPAPAPLETLGEAVEAAGQAGAPTRMTRANTPPVNAVGAFAGTVAQTASAAAAAMPAQSQAAAARRHVGGEEWVRANDRPGSDPNYGKIIAHNGDGTATVRFESEPDENGETSVAKVRIPYEKLSTQSGETLANDGTVSAASSSAPSTTRGAASPGASATLSRGAAAQAATPQDRITEVKAHAGEAAAGAIGDLKDSASLEHLDGLGKSAPELRSSSNGGAKKTATAKTTSKQQGQVTNAVATEVSSKTEAGKVTTTSTGEAPAPDADKAAPAKPANAKVQGEAATQKTDVTHPVNQAVTHKFAGGATSSTTEAQPAAAVDTSAPSLADVKVQGKAATQNVTVAHDAKQNVRRKFRPRASADMEPPMPPPAV
ncbi:hypothetical protein DB347_20770 [Opitutaceae bacterium EW11]|nr:hypothetical protein DB347_20770 [Opitutaceae bacterium EW11]